MIIALRQIRRVFMSSQISQFRLSSSSLNIKIYHIQYIAYFFRIVTAVTILKKTSELKQFGARNRINRDI